MKNPFVQFARRWVLRRDAVQAPTSLLPLKEIRRAVVFVDGLSGEDDPAVAGRIATRLLSDRGIDVRVLCAQKENTDWIGRLKAEARGEDGEDLFLCLSSSPDDFAAEYEARCRRARFKVGRCALPGGVYDLVAGPSPEDASPAGQTESIPVILDILDKIQ